jgi:dihydroorotate dehydrogenase (NAD+) catalytic subunit
MGGISTADEAIEMMIAGASSVQVGAAIFADAYTPKRVIDGMAAFCEREAIDNIGSITGTVILHEKDLDW